MEKTHTDDTPAPDAPMGSWMATPMIVLLKAAIIGIIAAGLALFVGDASTFDLLVSSWSHEGMGINWQSLGLHMLYSMAIWGTGAALFFWMRRGVSPQEGPGRVRVTSTSRGAVMVETLLILVPFLLLTSGLAQLAMLNVAGLLADLAAFQGARTAWIWQPEADAGRNGTTDDDVLFRARTASALVLAPTAGANFFVGRNFPRGSGPPFRRARTGITASFRSGLPLTGQQEWSMSANNWRYFQLSADQATAEFTSFSSALDTTSFHLRAGRKCTMAFMNLEDYEIITRDGSSGQEIGVSFTYNYNMLFPWFAYIWGRQNVQGMRVANYSPIPREFTFPAYPES